MACLALLMLLICLYSLFDKVTHSSPRVSCLSIFLPMILCSAAFCSAVLVRLLGAFPFPEADWPMSLGSGEVFSLEGEVAQCGGA